MIHSAEEFRRLRMSDVPEEYRRAAHEEAPLSVWLDVIRDYPDLRQWVAHNKTVPLEVLEILSRDEDPTVRSWVANKRKIPEALQLRLAQDPAESVSSCIAYNAKATRQALELLREHPDPEVRERVRERLESGDYKLG